MRLSHASMESGSTVATDETDRINSSNLEDDSDDMQLLNNLVRTMPGYPHPYTDREFTIAKIKKRGIDCPTIDLSYSKMKSMFGWRSIKTSNKDIDTTASHYLVPPSPMIPNTVRNSKDLKADFVRGVHFFDAEYDAIKCFLENQIHGTEYEAVQIPVPVNGISSRSKKRECLLDPDSEHSSDEERKIPYNACVAKRNRHRNDGLC